MNSDGLASAIMNAPLIGVATGLNVRLPDRGADHFVDQ